MAGGILAPLDGSALALQALPYAAYLARRCRAELLLAHVGGGGERPTAEDAAAHAQLAAAARRLRAEGVATTTVFGRGSTARSLVRLLRTRAPALLVLTTHGRSGPSRWALGGVCEQVLRASPVPVLLLTPRALAAGAPERLGRRIVVPIDGSELSRGVYPVVKLLARQLGDGVTLVRAVEPAAVWAASEAGSAAAGALSPDLLPEIEANLRRGLDRRAAEWRAEGIDAAAVVARGAAASVVAAAAARAGAGWIAMVGHGQGGLGGLALGSTALQIVQATTLPLLLVAAPPAGGYQVGADAAEGGR